MKRPGDGNTCRRPAGSVLVLATAAVWTLALTLSRGAQSDVAADMVFSILAVGLPALGAGYFGRRRELRRPVFLALLAYWPASMLATLLLVVSNGGPLSVPSRLLTLAALHLATVTLMVPAQDGSLIVFWGNAVWLLLVAAAAAVGVEWAKPARSTPAPAPSSTRPAPSPRPRVRRHPRRSGARGRGTDDSGHG